MSAGKLLDRRFPDFLSTYELTKKGEVDDRSMAGRVVMVRKHIDKKNGNVDYKQPVFESRETTAKEADLLETLTKWDADILQPWLKSKINGGRVEESTEPNTATSEPNSESQVTDNEDVDDSDLPF